MVQVEFQVSSKSDESAIVDFLWSIKDDLWLADRDSAAKITQLAFDKGGAIAGYHNDILVAMVGYFIGEPSQKYANKEVGFIYVAGLAKPYRLSRAMWNGLVFTMQHLQKLGMKEIRCHAREQDTYTNRLYSHFAKRLGTDVSLRGDPTVLYGNTIEGVLAYLNKGRTRQSTSPQTPTQIPVQTTSPTKLASPQTSSPQPHGSLWYCSPCNVWWFSDAQSAADKWRLERLVTIDELLQQQTHAPTQAVKGLSPLFCPNCGKKMATQPLSEPAIPTSS